MSAAILKNSPNVRENVPRWPFWAAILKEQKKEGLLPIFQKNRMLNMFYILFGLIDIEISSSGEKVQPSIFDINSRRLWIYNHWSTKNKQTE